MIGNAAIVNMGVLQSMPVGSAVTETPKTLQKKVENFLYDFMVSMKNDKAYIKMLYVGKNYDIDGARRYLWNKFCDKLEKTKTPAGEILTDLIMKYELVTCEDTLKDSINFVGEDTLYKELISAVEKPFIEEHSTSDKGRKESFKISAEKLAEKCTSYTSWYAEECGALPENLYKKYLKKQAGSKSAGVTTRAKRARTARTMRRASTKVRTPKTSAPRARVPEVKAPDVPKIDVKRLPKPRG